MGLGSIYLRSAEVQLSGLYEASIKQFQTLLFTVHKSKVLEKMQDSEKKISAVSFCLTHACQ